MRLRHNWLVPMLICCLAGVAQADEEYDRLKARLIEAERAFYKDQDALAEQVGWKNRSLPPTTSQVMEMERLRKLEPPRPSFMKDFYDYADSHAGHPEAMEAWAMVLTMPRCVISNGRYEEVPGVADAFRHLEEDHADDPNIGTAIDIITSRGSHCLPWDSLESLYKTIEARNRNPEIIAKCRMVRLRMHRQAQIYRGIMNRPTPDQEKADQEAARDLLHDLVRDYPDTEAGKIAEMMIFEETHLQVGQKLPEFEGHDLIGKAIHLSDFRGKVVMVVFWASWCGPCMARVPEEAEITAKFAGKPFAILGVNSDRTLDDFKKCLARKKEITWPNIFDGDPKTGKIAAALRIQAYPTVFLVDHEGMILAEGLYGERLEKAIAMAIEKVPVSPTSRPVSQSD